MYGTGHSWTSFFGQVKEALEIGKKKKTLKKCMSTFAPCYMQGHAASLKPDVYLTNCLTSHFQKWSAGHEPEMMHHLPELVLLTNVLNHPSLALMTVAA